MRKLKHIILLAALLSAAAAQSREALRELDALEISSLPLSRAVEDYAQPADILLGRELEERLQLSLGDTLDGLPGVSSTRYFPGASRPIIRGFSNDRIRVMSDGIDTLDASVGSLDHAVAMEPLAVDRIEIIRGPATLLYGSNAVGGAVNVIDSRIPRGLPEQRVEGRYGLSGESVSRGWTGRYDLMGRAGDGWAWQSSGLRRRHGDVDIPAFGALDPEVRDQQRRGRLNHSFVDTDVISAGLSRVFETGFAGGALSRFITRYGIGQEVEEEIVGIDGDGALIIERELDDLVMIDLDRWRFDTRAGVTFREGLIEEARLRFGVGGYEHAELEDGEAGTFFRNRAWEGRIELVHRERGRLNGAWGLQASRSKFEATGDEAFLRPTDSRKFSLFAFEEYALDNATLQFGARWEHHRVTPEFFERDEIEGRTEIPPAFRRNGLSGSLGSVIVLPHNLRFSFALNYTQRIPSAQELYADGPHVGTFAYEISDHVSNLDFKREVARGVDLGLRWNGRRSRWEAGIFYNRFDDFIQLRRTGEFAFENEDETFTIVPRSAIDNAFLDQRLADGEENEFLQVTRYVLSDAEYFGFEWESITNLYTAPERDLDWTVRADYVQARERATGEALARIPPLRLMTGLDWTWRNWVLGGDFSYRFRQTRRPEVEGETAGFAMLNLRARWTIDRGDGRFVLSGRLENALNREARDATSFVRELTTRPGRNLILSLDYVF